MSTGASTPCLERPVAGVAPATAQVHLYGEVRLFVDGVDIATTGAQSSALVALLALGSGRLLSVPELRRRLYPGHDESRSRANVHALVARLRRAVRADVLRSSGAGYQFVPGRLWVDAHELATALQVMQSQPTGQPGRHGPAATEQATRAAERLRELVTCTAGEPLGGIDADWALVEAPRLLELRLQAVESLVDWELAATGRTRQVGDLESLLVLHPLRETLVARLVRALAAHGRPAEALARYERTRRYLASTLGADPGPELRELHAAVLSGHSDRVVNMRYRLGA